MTEKSKFDVLKHLWLEDVGMSALLVFVMVTNFVVQPIFADSSIIRIINGVLFLSITISGIWLLVEKRSYQIIATLVPIASVLIDIYDKEPGFTNFLYLKTTLIVAIFMITILLILKRVFGPGEVNHHKIIGAILVFVLAGNMFATLYEIFASVMPSAFLLPSSIQGVSNNHVNFLYFSYTTLTTTGFGDITPVHPLAKSLVSLEQLFGLLYPILLIGRLVSLNITGKTEKPS
jgi:hypothetical protein